MLEIELAKELISRKSITPSDGGCLKFTADYLEIRISKRIHAFRRRR